MNSRQILKYYKIENFYKSINYASARKGLNSILGIVVNAKALSIMRYQDDINTEHNMKSIGRAAMAQ